MVLPALLAVGCDFSDGARSAVRLASAWAARTGADLELVHALSGSPTDPDALALLSRELRRVVEDTGADADGRRPGCTVARRPAPQVLAGLAALGPATWLVLGAEGASAASLPVGGRLTRQLARSPAAPLLVAPTGWELRRASGVATRALVAVRDERDEDGLLPRAAALATRLAGRLAAASVIDATDAAAWPEPLRETALHAARQDAESRRAALQVAFEETVPVELGDEVHVACGGPVARDLAGLAESQHVDLLVVGAGETAAELVSVSRCPLLVLPRGASLSVGGGA